MTFTDGLSSAFAMLAGLALIVILWDAHASRRERLARGCEPADRFQRTVRKHVVIHTKSGHSLDGVLSGIYADSVTLTAAKFLRPGEGALPLDGEQIIPLERIEWTQELTDAGSEE